MPGFGLGRVFFWPFAVVVDGPPFEEDDRKLSVFAFDDRMLEDAGEIDELPLPDRDLDVLFAVDHDTDEVITITRKVGTAVFAEHLAGAALELGALIVDDDGEVRPPDAEVASPARSEGPSVAVQLVHALVSRHVIELADKVTTEVLATALEEAVAKSSEKARLRAVLAVFEGPLVDEIFVDDDELKTLAKSFARELA